MLYAHTTIIIICRAMAKQGTIIIIGTEKIRIFEHYCDGARGTYLYDYIASETKMQYRIFFLIHQKSRKRSPYSIYVFFTTS